MTVADTDWRRELVRLLSSASSDDWERARVLKMGKVPERLFRYRPPTDFSLSGLERGTIWLSAASELNDLHDTSLAVDVNRGFDTNLRKALADGSLRLPPGLAASLTPTSEDPVGVMDALFSAEIEKQDGPEAARRAKDFFRKFLLHESAGASHRLTKFMQRATKVACFCDANTEAVLWAQYADDHRGFCVEYSMAGLPEDDLRLRWLYPVVYTAEPFELSRLIERLEGKPNVFTPQLAAMHKATAWAHEREWRIIAPLGDNNAGCEWRMPMPVGVYIGSRMTTEHRDRIIVYARRSSVPVFEMAPSPGSFSLVPSRIA